MSTLMGRSGMAPIVPRATNDAGAPRRRRRVGWGGANDQAFARLNVRAAIQTAMAARIVVITTPMAISGLPQSLLNRARAASVAWVSGLRLLRNRSHSGARAIGNRI